jgi:hypothetical protein
MAAMDAVLLLATLVLVVGIAIPVAGFDLRHSELMEAQHTTVAIADGVFAYRKDIGSLASAAPVHVPLLLGPGEVPELGAFGGTTTASLDNLLRSGRGAGFQWRGPYVEKIGADPWGRAYVVLLGGFQTAQRKPWILSAGPNGLIETDPGSMVCGGDDIGYVVREPRAGVMAPGADPALQEIVAWAPTDPAPRRARGSR